MTDARELLNDAPPEEIKRGHTRRIIGEVINEETTRQKIRDLIDSVMQLSGLSWGYCPQCKTKIQVEVPDIKGRVDALIKLLEQAEGKPQEGESGTTIVIERNWPRSTEQLIELLASGKTEGESATEMEAARQVLIGAGWSRPAKESADAAGARGEISDEDNAELTRHADRLEAELVAELGLGEGA